MRERRESASSDARFATVLQSWQLLAAMAVLVPCDCPHLRAAERLSAAATALSVSGDCNGLQLCHHFVGGAVTGMCVCVCVCVCVYKHTHTYKYRQL